MAAIVCHGLQSHLDSQHTESIALKLRLSSSKPSPPQLLDLAFKSCMWDSNPTTKPHIEEKSNPTLSNTNSWSILDTLSIPKEPSQDQTPYVHPQQKRSTLRLSPKSLELCTESLGNESGSDSDESSIDMLSSLKGNSETREQRQPRQLWTAEKAKTKNFPPPLTTIRGSESLRMKPHREDGRLVIEATKVPPIPSCFQAERSHGRLRLRFLTNHTPSFVPQDQEDDVEENDMIGQVKDSGTKEEVKEETEQKTEEEEKEERVACGCVDSDVIMMPRRCKEGGDQENSELLNWCEPLWVAIS